MAPKGLGRQRAKGNPRLRLNKPLKLDELLPSVLRGCKGVRSMIVANCMAR